MRWPWKCLFLVTATRESEITTLDGAPHCQRWPGQRNSLSVTHSPIPPTGVWPHLQVPVFPSTIVPLNHPPAPRRSLHRHQEPPQLLSRGRCDPLRLGTFPFWTLLRPAEHHQIIVTNSMAVIIAVITLLVLLLVPSYHFHLMLLMFWSLFR